MVKKKQQQGFDGFEMSADTEEAPSLDKLLELLSHVQKFANESLDNFVDKFIELFPDFNSKASSPSHRHLQDSLENGRLAKALEELERVRPRKVFLVGSETRPEWAITCVDIVRDLQQKLNQKFKLLKKLLVNIYQPDAEPKYRSTVAILMRKLLQSENKYGVIESNRDYIELLRTLGLKACISPSCHYPVRVLSIKSAELESELHWVRFYDDARIEEPHPKRFDERLDRLLPPRHEHREVDDPFWRNVLRRIRESLEGEPENYENAERLLRMTGKRVRAAEAEAAETAEAAGAAAAAAADDAEAEAAADDAEAVRDSRRRRKDSVEGGDSSKSNEYSSCVVC